MYIQCKFLLHILFCWASDYKCIQLKNSRIDTHLFCANVEMEVMEFRIRIADKIKLKLMKYTIEESTILREKCDFLPSQNFSVTCFGCSGLGVAYCVLGCFWMSVYVHKYIYTCKYMSGLVV